MMDEEYLRQVCARIHEFMKNTDMKGYENPDYVECWNFLDSVGSGDFDA